MADIFAGFHLFFTLENFLALAAGMAIGIIVGAIPGLTATMAIVLALPFTFTMPAETALLLLVGIYKGAIFAGSISAILIKAPGTPASACTILDGWPLAQQGQTRKALDVALYSSCIADFISNLSLIFFAGFIAGFALRFGPPEFFWLISFSLTVVISVSGRSLLKGLISASLGLLLSTVGMDLVYGGPRLTFGVLELTGGISFVPLLIGLFALPEILDYYTRKVGAATKNAATGERLTWAEFRRCLTAVVRGSLIGVVIGAIPGTGPSVASFLSYAEARRTSKQRLNFGKGEIEGVAAAEAGNNGVAGATLIPLLALGVPGDVMTAVMIGAFLIHGIAPGPLLFQNHAPFVYAIFWGIMLTSVFMLVAGKIATRNFARVADIPSHVLMPTVLIFCVFGSYAINNSVFDVLVMLCAGVLGLVMLRFDIAPAPLLIGFILGPLFEDNLRRSILMGQGDLTVFVRNEITWVFMVLTALSLIIGIRQQRASARAGA
jgi:putative tricarboxylic transport membrane protein